VLHTTAVLKTPAVLHTPAFRNPGWPHTRLS